MSTSQVADTLSAVITRIVGTPLPVEPETQHARLLDLGMDSLRLVRLVAQLEDVFDIKIAPADLAPERFDTFGAVCGLVADYLADPGRSESDVPAAPVRTGGVPEDTGDAEDPPGSAFPIEAILLMLTARTQMTPAQVARARAILTNPAYGLDRGRFVELAARHRVINLVARNLDRERLTPKDPVLHAQLRGSYLYNVNRNRALQAELRLLLAEFDRHGINAVLRKGTYLTNRVYPDPGLRFSVDLDIYVPGAEMDRYCALMTDLGYRQGSMSENRRIIQPMTRDEEVFSRLHESALPPFWRITSDPYVDIFGIDASHNMMPPPSGKSLPAEDILARAHRGEVAGEAVWIPSAEDMLLDLAVHLYREAIWFCSIESGKDICLIRFVDIVEWCRAAGPALDTDRLAALAEQYDLVPETYYGLHHTDVLYPGVIDPGLLDRLRPDDLGYLDEFGRLDRQQRFWPTPFLERVFHPDRAAGLDLGVSA